MFNLSFVRPSYCIQKLLLLPLFTGILHCSAQNSSSNVLEVNGGQLIATGMQLEFSQPEYDTIYIEDPITLERYVKIKLPDPKVISINGIAIKDRKDLSELPKILQPEKINLLEYLLTKTQMKKWMEAMEDGTYNMRLDDIVLDPSGHVVYYRLEMPQGWKITPNGQKLDILAPFDQQTKNDIHTLIRHFLVDSLQVSPAKDQENLQVPYYLPDYMVQFDLKDHKIVFVHAIPEL